MNLEIYFTFSLRILRNLHRLSIAEQFNLQKPHLFKTEDIGRGSWLSVKDVTKLKNMYGCPGDKNVTLHFFYPVIYLVRFISIYVRLKEHGMYKSVQFLHH